MGFQVTVVVIVGIVTGFSHLDVNCCHSNKRAEYRWKIPAFFLSLELWLLNASWVEFQLERLSFKYEMWKKKVFWCIGIINWF